MLENNTGMLFENKSHVEIDPDQMQAWLYLVQPKDGTEYTEEDIYQLLKAKNIVYGLHKSNLKAVVKKKIYAKKVLIAKGDTCTPTEPGYYEYHVSPVKIVETKIVTDGNIDYRTMEPLPDIVMGDKIATYYPSIVGENGISVTGEVVKAEPEIDLAPLRGDVLERVEQKILKVYYANNFGRINIKNGYVDIRSQYDINEDVTNVSGFIEFAGDIVVYGNVGTGAHIKADRHVIVKGSVEGATIEAGGDIIMQQGINGGNQAKLTAGDHIYADFIEYSEVIAGGNIQSNVIMNSKVSVKGEVILTGREGYIIGGTTHAYKGITAMQFGNEMELPTQLHVGYNETDYRELLVINRKVKKTKEELDKVSLSLATLMQSMQKNPNASVIQKNQLQVMTVEKTEVEESYNGLVARQAELQLEVDGGQGGVITCNGKIYRGVRVSIGKEVLSIFKTTSFMKYENENGMITPTVVVY